MHDVRNTRLKTGRIGSSLHCWIAIMTMKRVWLECPFELIAYLSMFNHIILLGVVKYD